MRIVTLILFYRQEALSPRCVQYEYFCVHICNFLFDFMDSKQDFAHFMDSKDFAHFMDSNHNIRK